MASSRDGQIGVEVPHLGQTRTEGTRTVSVAAFRSPGTDVIGDCVGFPVAVIAATDDPMRLRKQLSRTWHGFWHAAPPHVGEPFRKDDVEPSDARYEILHLEAQWMRRTPFPNGVSLESGVLIVEVPAEFSAGELDAFLACALYDMRFDVVAQQPAEVLRRHASGLPSHIEPRYACLPGRTPRLVQNCYAFRDRDLPGLVKAVAMAAEGLVLRHRLMHHRFGFDPSRQASR